MQRTSHRTAKTARSTTRRTSRNRKSEVDAISVLTEDHKKVQKIFKEFEKLKDTQDNESKMALVTTACAELKVHTQLEEEIFYPSVREALEDGSLIDEAEVEHASAKQLISELEGMQPGDELYDAKFTVLGEYINHHIKEEQNEIFPQAKKAKVDMTALGKEILQRKAELKGESGEEPEDESGELEH